jgi:hypothetical protein
VLNIGSQHLPVRIRNMSAGGALIDGPDIPAAGARVLLVRGSLRASGHVAWREKGQAGIAFEAAVKTSLWIAKAGHAGQQRVDDVVAAIRHSEPLPQDAPLLPEQALVDLSTTLDDICDRLLMIGAISEPLGEELVRLDAVAQSLRLLAGRKADQR